MSRREIEAMRTDATAALDESPDGSLPLAVRTAIGLALGPNEDLDARKRRVALDRLCVERVLPAWSDLHPDDHRPERMLTLAQQILDGGTDTEDPTRERDRFYNDAGEIDRRDPEGRSACAAFGALATLDRASRRVDDYDALPPETTEEDLDFDSWDAPYWASLATTGGLQGRARASSPTRLLALVHRRGSATCCRRGLSSPAREALWRDA